MSSPTTFTYCSKWNHPIYTPLVVERRVPTICLKIDLTSCCNELFCDGLMAFLGRVVEWCEPSFLLKIDIAAQCNEVLRELRRYGRMPFLGRLVQWRAAVLQ
jgi:hypothetical protein